MELENIKKAISENKVVLFMKGIPDAPACGFSKNAVLILRKLNIDFISFNVLEDDGLRNNIKEFSNWPTIPQLYINGEFIGGSDIMVEMYKNNEFDSLVNS